MFWIPGKHGEILSADSHLSINFDEVNEVMLTQAIVGGNEEE